MDCIIILANLMDKNGVLNDESKARVELANELFLKWPHSTIITSGWAYRKDSAICIGNAMKAYSREIGIPEEKIIVDVHSKDTVGDAIFTKVNVVMPKGWKTIAAVTSDYHVNRTNEIFKFVYGPEYQIQVFGAGYFTTPEKIKSEQDSLKMFYTTFEGVRVGDTNSILQRMKERHPYYPDIKV
jgi:uncharacterized SAM-binding protein YcdF (DUF218 family)